MEFISSEQHHSMSSFIFLNDIPYWGLSDSFMRVDVIVHFSRNERLPQKQETNGNKDLGDAIVCGLSTTW